MEGFGTTLPESRERTTRPLEKNDTPAEWPVTLDGVCATFPVIVLSRISRPDRSVWTPAPSGARFPETVELRMMVEYVEDWMPPPRSRSDVLPEMVLDSMLAVIVGESEPPTLMPPPRW